jgi:hypothetical protein
MYFVHSVGDQHNFTVSVRLGSHRLGFLAPGARNLHGGTLTQITNFKKSQLFIEYLFSWVGDLKFIEHTNWIFFSA